MDSEVEPKEIRVKVEGSDFDKPCELPTIPFEHVKVEASLGPVKVEPKFEDLEEPAFKPEPVDIDLNTQFSIDNDELNIEDKPDLVAIDSGVNNNKKERQKRYREQNRDKLKQREAERRKRIQYSQSIVGPSTSSNTNRIELNNEERITAQSSFSLEKTQLLSIQRNEQGNELNALQKKRERQQRYREQNRDKLKQREAERRKRLQNAEMITKLSTSPNIEFTEIINDPIIDEISTDSRSEAGLEEKTFVLCVPSADFETQFCQS